MVCRYCGKEIDSDAAFCSACGAATGQSPNRAYPNRPQAMVSPPAPPQNKLIYKKWWFWALLAIDLIMVLIFIGFSFGDAIKGSAKGDYIVTIKESEVAENLLGDKILIVTYSFTNNGNEPISFTSAIEEKLFQNGVELESAYYTFGLDGYDFDSRSKDIQPGVTFDVQSAYELNDETGDVEVQIEEFLSPNNNKLTYTITID